MSLWQISFVLCLVVYSSHGSSIEESIFNLGPRIFNHQLMESAREVPDNLIVSPIGLSVGLGLIETTGSKALRQLILEDFFHWTGGEESFQANLTSVHQQLRSAYQQQQPRQNQSQVMRGGKVLSLEDVTVNLQSAIFKGDHVELAEDFRRRAVQDYNSEIISLNRSLTPSERQSRVDEWARNATKDLIKSFPVPMNFDILLANTVYFEGDWVQPFADLYTRKNIFRPTLDANTFVHNVSYLQGQLEDIPYYENEQLQMIKLSYVIKNSSASDISMFVMLPKRGKGLTEQIHRLNFTTFKDIIKNQMRNFTVNVKLPKVSLKHRIDVKQVMEEFEERKARRWRRDGDSLNVRSGLTSNGTFVLSDFIQDTVLEVNEKGTRAASITGGTINYDGTKKNFRCERPYLMVIYDSTHDTVLFWAAIFNPKKD